MLCGQVVKIFKINILQSVDLTSPEETNSLKDREAKDIRHKKRKKENGKVLPGLALELDLITKSKVWKVRQRKNKWCAVCWPTVSGEPLTADLGHKKFL